MKVRSAITLSDRTLPLALLALCVMAFGLNITRQGFYWDDWAKSLVNWLYGPAGYWAYYAEDRPFSGWTHIVLNPVLGYSPLRWQLFTLALRWLSAWGMWWVFSGVWRSARKPIALAACLFAVYPVFTLQPAAVTFHQQWLQYALFFFSLGAMIHAIRHPKAYLGLTLLSIAGLIAQLSITEYFAPLEGLRPVLLWLMVAPKGETLYRKLWVVGKRYWVYFIVAALYVMYRLFLIRLPGDDPYRPDTLYSLVVQPVHALSQLLKSGLTETYYILLGGWKEVLDFGVSTVPRSQLKPNLVMGMWGVAALVMTGMGAYLTLLKSPEDTDELQSRARLQMALVGLLAIGLGALPAWISGRHVLDDYHANRYAMASMFGASLVWAATITHLVRNQLHRAILTAAILALATSYHYRITTDYAELWQRQTDLYWQLSWRAPHLKNGTALLFEAEVFPNQGLFSTSSAINFLYPQPKSPPHLAYWVYLIRHEMAERYQRGEIIKLNTRFRTLHFEGEIPNSVIIYYDPGRANCMWILTSADADNPDLMASTRQMVTASNLNRIEPRPIAEGYPPTTILGAEPPHDFCYRYQKAELARQQGDWGAVTEQADLVLAAGNLPEDAWFKTPQEWLPFIEGYAHTGRWDKAAELTLSAHKINPDRYRERFCNLWERIESSDTGLNENARFISSVQTELGCGQ